jgi:1-acyl-sn-glycerol-3-phosphate acyltransferase
MSRRSVVNDASASPTPDGYSAAVYSFSKWLLRVWARVWLRLRIEGVKNTPLDGPLLLVGNHASYLDPPLLGCGLPRPVLYLAQKGLGKFPPLRWWMRKVGVGLIDRNAPSKDVLRFLSDALQKGACVAMFPEGTRSKDGSVAPFRSGVEFLVRRTGCSVLPIGIDGAFAAYPRGVLFPRPRKCVVRVGEAWSKDRVLAPGGVDALRREVARLANARVASEIVEAQVGNGPGSIPVESQTSAGSRS